MVNFSVYSDKVNYRYLMAFRDLAQSNNYDLSFITKSVLLTLQNKPVLTKPENTIRSFCLIPNEAYQKFFFTDRQEVNNTVLYSELTPTRRLHACRFVTGEFFLYVKDLGKSSIVEIDPAHPTDLFVFSTFPDLCNALKLYKTY